jgi:hypothetical protein
MAAVRVRDDDGRLVEALHPVADGRVEIRDGTGPVDSTRSAASAPPAASPSATGDDAAGDAGRHADRDADTGGGGGGADRSTPVRYVPQQRLHLPEVGTSGWLPL